MHLRVPHKSCVLSGDQVRAQYSLLTPGMCNMAATLSAGSLQQYGMAAGGLQQMPSSGTVRKREADMNSRAGEAPSTLLT